MTLKSVSWFPNFYENSIWTIKRDVESCQSGDKLDDGERDLAMCRFLQWTVDNNMTFQAPKRGILATATAKADGDEEEGPEPPGVQWMQLQRRELSAAPSEENTNTDDDMNNTTRTSPSTHGGDMMSVDSPTPPFSGEDPAAPQSSEGGPPHSPQIVGVSPSSDTGSVRSPEGSPEGPLKGSHVDSQGNEFDRWGQRVVPLNPSFECYRLLSGEPGDSGEEVYERRTGEVPPSQLALLTMQSRLYRSFDLPTLEQEGTLSASVPIVSDGVTGAFRIAEPNHSSEMRYITPVDKEQDPAFAGIEYFTGEWEYEWSEMQAVLHHGCLTIHEKVTDADQ